MKLSRKLLLVLLLTLPAVAEAQFTYSTTGGKVTITGYTGLGGAVAIPNTISGLPVASIGDSAFYNIPSLTGVTFGTNVTSIGNYAFEACTNLTSVLIPPGVTSIGSFAFQSCDNLPGITVDPLNLSFSSAGGVLCNQSQTTLLECPGGKAGSYLIPNSVISIAPSAFYYCPGLTSVTLGTNVASIGNSAFDSCLSLTNITIPKSVTSMGATVFYSCDSLTNITVDPLNPFYSSADGVLFNQNQTTLIEFPGGKAGSYTVPQSVTNIGSSAFTVCRRLSNVTMDTNVLNISDSSFVVCTSLTNVILGPNVTNLGNYSFYGCTSLAGATIPDKVVSLGGNAFAGCSRLASVTIGTNVTSIGTIAFGSCTNLTSVMIPASVTNIGTRAFAVCTSLTNATIGKSVISIGSAAFESCSSLAGITVDPLNPFYSSVDGVLFNKNQTTLIEYPGGKSGNYTVPNTVTNIASRAFAYCTSLKGVYIYGNAPGAGATVFASATNSPVYYLPGTTGWGAAFGGRPTALWLPQASGSSNNFGLPTNQFGFTVNWASGQTVVVITCTNLASPNWIPLQTNTLSNSSAYFSDPQWTNYPGRFYRLRSP